MSDYNNGLHRGRLCASRLRSLQKIALTLLCSFASLVSAQQLVDISSCARITDDKDRFACYDNLARAAGVMPRAPAASATPAVPSAPATVVVQPTPAPATAVAPAPAAQAVAPAVGTSIDSTRIAAFGNANQARIETTATQEMLIDTVAALKFYKQDVWLITLSSGQVWRQMIDGRFLLRAGDTVHIVPNPWGSSFRLTAEGRNGFIQVEKIANK